MNKKDLIPVILLALLIPLWMTIDRILIAPKFADNNPAPIGVQAEEPTAAEATNAVVETADQTVTVPEEPSETIPEPKADEITAVLSNDKLHVELTSWGAGIKSVTLMEYPEYDEKESSPVELDFTGAPALVYEGVPGLEASDAFNLTVAEDGRSAVFSKKAGNLIYERTIELGDGYLLSIMDRFTADGETVALPSMRLISGYMENPADLKSMKGLSILGVDSYDAADGVHYWGRKLNKFYKNADKADKIDQVPPKMDGKPVEWVSAKNMFFTQIIRPEASQATIELISNRDTSQKGIVPSDIAAALAYQSIPLADGESLNRDYTYYVGPKKYSILKEAGYGMEGVMEFETIGFWSFMNWLMHPSRKALLWSLNVLEGIFRNYGVAIILLTLIVRVLFWPLTHKSTESMKRMQEIQPEVKALQEKYKKDPQRAQQEVMKLYREKKVNPMGGCLPMFVQIPVFFALYSVLRNAIELRYEGFLWISDLSQPENLLMGHIPIVGALNILPIVMAVSMIWQQKLTSPSTAVTPEQQQQQKIMMFMMPVMMLFFFYSMPSGLVLYWTTSNLLMIAQTSLRNLRKKVKEA